jgi:hypothetical protein
MATPVSFRSVPHGLALTFAVLAAAVLAFGPPTSAAASAPTPTPTPSATPAELVPFGADQGIIWEDRVQASVLSAERFTPSDTAVGLGKGHTGVKITVRLGNGSKVPVDLRKTTVNLRFGPDRVQSERVSDLRTNIGLGFEGSLTPGRLTTAVYGFSVPPGQLKLLNVEVAPGQHYMTATFHGSAS